jgi:hypothetical protein
MRPLSLSALALAALLVAWGCNPPPVAKDASSSTTGGVNSPASTTGTTDGKAAPTSGTTGEATTGTLNASGPGPSVADIPADLKETDAYKYYGLDNPKPVDMELVISPKNETLTGATVITLKEIKDRKAIYSIERTGGLHQYFGSEEDSLEPDGLHMISSSVGKLSSDRTLQVPSKLTPGTTWTVNTTLNTASGTATENTTYKVVGVQSVKTKVGTYDNALVVTSNGEATVQGVRNVANGKQWLVPGRGLVRYEISLTDTKKKTKTSFLLQETKGG